jgi:proteasome lid subunit RPN8/RPN11
VAQPSRQDTLRRQAAELRSLAERGMSPRKYRAEAESLEAEAARLDQAQPITELSPEASQRQDALEGADREAASRLTAQQVAQAERQRAAAEQGAKEKASQDTLFGGGVRPLTEDRGRKLDQRDLFGESIESRSKKYGGGEKQENLFRDLERAGSEAKSQHGNIPDGPRPGFGGAVTKYSRISRKLERRGHIEFRGQNVKHAEDVAVLMQIGRDPRLETGRFLLVNDAGDVLAAEAVTSHAVSHVNLTSEYVSSPRFIYEMKNRMRRLGATGYHFVHNHPAGSAKPSGGDVNVTRILAEKIPGLKSSVVIDHGKYGVVRPETGFAAEVHDLPPEARRDYDLERVGAETTNPLPQTGGLVRATPRGFQPGYYFNRGGLSASGIAQFAYDMTAPDAVALLHVSAAGELRALEQMPAKNFTTGAENERLTGRPQPKGGLADYIRGQQKAYGAHETIAYSNDRGAAAAGEHLVQKGLLRDFVTAEQPRRGRSAEQFRESQEAHDAAADFYDPHRRKKPLQRISEEVEPALKEKEPEELPKYAANINLHRLNTDADTKALIHVLGEKYGKLARVPLSEIEKAAHDLGFTVEEAEHAASATTRQRANFLAVREVHVAAAEGMKKAQAAYASEQSAANFEKLRTATVAEIRAFKATRQIAKEAGLALRTFGMQAEAGNPFPPRARRAIDDLLEKIQKRGKLSDEVVGRLAQTDLGDPEAVQRLINYLSPRAASWSDKFYEAYLASLLSGPKTHVVNTVSNFATAGLEVGKEAAAGAVDFARSAITGAPRERYVSDAVHDLVGMWGGAQEGLRAFAKTMRTGQPATRGTAFDIRAGAIEGTKGRIIRSPLTALSAEDEFFKSVARRGAINVAAYREARAKGLKGRALSAEAERLLSAPTEEMFKYAQDVALDRTFQNPLGPAGKAMNRIRMNTPIGRHFLRWLIPFQKTPTNIALKAISYSPLNAIRMLAREGGENRFRGGELSDEIAKMALGTAFGAGVAAYALQGKVSGGGPPNGPQRDSLYATGWQPYSFKVGKKWVSYARIEPLSTVLGLAADATEIADHANDEEWGKISTAVGLGLSKNLTSKTFLTGLSDALEALHDPERYGQKLVSSFAGSVVPSVAAQTARAMDPKIREAKGIIERIKSRIPKVREQVKAKRDIRGAEVPATGNFWERLVSPVETSPERGGEIEKLIVDLGASVGPVRDTMLIKGKRLRLDSKQHDRLQQLTGQAVDERLSDMEEEIDDLREMPREEAAARVKAQIERGRASGRRQFIAEEIESGRMKESDFYPEGE